MSKLGYRINRGRIGIMWFILDKVGPVGEVNISHFERGTFYVQGERFYVWETAKVLRRMVKDGFLICRSIRGKVGSKGSRNFYRLGPIFDAMVETGQWQELVSRVESNNFPSVGPGGSEQVR